MQGQVNNKEELKCSQSALHVRANIAANIAVKCDTVGLSCFIVVIFTRINPTTLP